MFQLKTLFICALLALMISSISAGRDPCERGWHPCGTTWGDCCQDTPKPVDPCPANWYPCPTARGCCDPEVGMPRLRARSDQSWRIPGNN